jgi:aspartate/methionine/tyrosine aminotransferase
MPLAHIESLDHEGRGVAHVDILFFNGLGDAIQTSFLYLHHVARVLGPNPAYPTHSSAEGAHARAPHLTYDLLPEKEWLLRCIAQQRNDTGRANGLARESGEAL